MLSSLQLTEERQANLARKEAAADAANERVAKQKAIAEAEARAKFLQAESDRLMVSAFGYGTVLCSD